MNAGNPSPDYDGSARKGMNLFTNSILALNLQTGKLAWHYQTIHHEIWDFDLVTGPMLFDVMIGGRAIKGVGSASKNCLLYLWHRETGQPINPMVETPVATATDVPGEEVWPTQPFPYTAKGVPMQPFCSTFPMVTDPELVKRARPLYTPVLDQRDVHRLAWRVELRADVVQSPNRFVVRDREERRGRAIGEAGRRYAAPEHPVAWPLRQHCGRTAALEGCRDGRHGNGDGLSPRQRRGGVAEGTPDPIGHWQFGKHCHRRRPGVSGQRHGDFYAYHARSGEPLFKHTATRSIRSNPITYRVNGRQYVAIVATNTILAFGDSEQRTGAWSLAQ